MARKPATVLIVDGERITADALAVLLEQNGFIASAVYNGESALERLRTGVPDAVIVDIKAPGMTGLELAITIRDSWPACKVVLLTGSAASKDVLVEAQKRGYKFVLLSRPDLLDELHRSFKVSCLRPTEH